MNISFNDNQMSSAATNAWFRKRSDQWTEALSSAYGRLRSYFSYSFYVAYEDRRIFFACPGLAVVVIGVVVAPPAAAAAATLVRNRRRRKKTIIIIIVVLTTTTTTTSAAATATVKVSPSLPARTKNCETF